MYYEKTRKLIDELGEKYRIAVFNTMGNKYPCIPENIVIFPLTKESDFSTFVGSIAQSGHFDIFIFDKITNLHPSYMMLHSKLEFLSDLAKKYNLTIFT